MPGFLRGRAEGSRLDFNKILPVLLWHVLPLPRWTEATLNGNMLKIGLPN
jgi:hypothetical protein